MSMVVIVEMVLVEHETVGVLAGMVIEAEGTKEEITGAVMILMASMVNLNLVVVMMICLLMDSLPLRLIVEVVTVTAVGGQTMTVEIPDVNQVGTAITVENAGRPIKVKNGQGSGDGFQMDLR